MVANADLDNLTRAQLITLAEVRGVELPTGRLTKADLVELLRAAAERKAQ